jgi:hypothetical protein
MSGLLSFNPPISRNTPSTTNLEEEEIVDAPGNDGNASMPEQVKRPIPCRIIIIIIIIYLKQMPFIIKAICV